MVISAVFFWVVSIAELGKVNELKRETHMNIMSKNYQEAKKNYLMMSNHHFPTHSSCGVILKNINL